MRSVHGPWSLVLGVLAMALFEQATLSAAEPLRVSVWLGDGREVHGTLAAMSSDVLKVHTETDDSWKWADVVSLRLDDRAAPAEPRGAAIWLANGDRLVARVTAIRDEQLLAEWLRFGDWPALKLPLESVRGVSLSLPQAREQRDRAAEWLLDRRAGRDDVRLLNGDMISGEMDRLENGSLVLSAGAKDVTLPIGDVREFGFNSELLALPEPPEPCWLVSLRDGSRVTLVASKSRLVGEVLQATHVTGAVWNIPWSSVCELRVLRGRAVYLSDLTPLETRHTPFLEGSRAWPLRRDRSVIGGPLRLSGRESPKGIGQHSRSTATFELNGKYRVFRAMVGLDDASSGLGTAIGVIEVDGRRVFESSLSRGNAAQSIGPIDLSGAKRLTLLTDFGELGDVQDHVNWCDAVLLP